jgi:cation diffusion facilitator CzcD-associated flavoprotein CzcO
VGAGLSGVCAAYHLQTRCPGKRFTILESRQAMGGTWDLFRYPGVRSDSDMFTLGYSFRPWQSDKSIASGPAIRQYIRDTAQAYGIDSRIRYGHKAINARWCSQAARWTVEVEVQASEGNAPPSTLQLSCNFLYMCSGYYSYASGYTPDWAGLEQYQGRLIHPQQWPEELDYSGKRIVVIGSGATAVTLLPELARQANQVTMLQRSPTYIVARPSRDAISTWLRRYLPEHSAHSLTRWKNILLGMYFYNLARKKPAMVKHMILKAARQQLGQDYDVATHLTPRYNPWDQRLCLIPDADLFQALRSGKANIVTGEIASFTPDGIRLASGQHLQADIIVTATGLQLQVMGGMQMIVDGQHIAPAATLTYKGMMYSDVPNLAVAMGYTNASWTLKCELSAKYVCRLLNHMDAKGYQWFVPRRHDPALRAEPALALTSGYVQRAEALLPKQGSKKPWKLYQNYVLDTFSLKYGAVDDGTMEFGRAAFQPTESAQPTQPAAPAMHQAVATHESQVQPSTVEPIQ